VNFVINISGDRPIGVVERLVWSSTYGRAISELKGAELHHVEYRQDQQTAAGFVALVYKLPDRP
jgi:hypothetical protein